MMKKMWKVIFLIVLHLTSSLFAISSLDPYDPKWVWMDRQIEKEFESFKKGITQKMIDQVMNNRNNLSFSKDYHRYKVIKGKVFGKEGHHGPKRFLELLASLYPLPDIDVVIFTQDICWNHWEIPGPVLCTCKEEHYKRMIYFPVQCWEMWVEQTKQITKVVPSSPWESKIDSMCWRGTACGPNHLKNGLEQWRSFERGRVVYWSQQFPEIINAAFTAAPLFLFASKEQREEFLSYFPLKRASWEEYLGHKYLIDLDGYVASTPGTAWKLLSNCAVFKRDSRFQLWFSQLLRPWIHYIPLKEDLSDIFEKITWAQDHDLEVQVIAEQGRAFASENLTIEPLLLYCYKVLKKYASLQQFEPYIPYESK